MRPETSTALRCMAERQGDAKRWAAARYLSWLTGVPAGSSARFIPSPEAATELSPWLEWSSAPTALCTEPPSPEEMLMEATAGCGFQPASSSAPPGQRIQPLDGNRASHLCGRRRRAQPTGDLVFDRAGNIYGTASCTSASCRGSVYELSPPVAAGQKLFFTRLAWEATATIRLAE